MTGMAAVTIDASRTADPGLGGPFPARTAGPAAADGTFLERLKANAQKLVRITPVDAPAGNDSTDIIARIRFDAAHGDIAAALADLNQLPDPAKTIAADWTKKAESRGAAIAGSRQIAADALAALSKPSAQ